jgi:hypothetical protein
MDRTTQDTVERGRRAWTRIQLDRPGLIDFADWLVVAEALLVGIEICERAGGFDRAMMNWLRTNNFDSLDRGLRSRLLELLRHRIEVETWRVTLHPHERRRKNHPNSIWNGWQQSQKRGAFLLRRETP